MINSHTSNNNTTLCSSHASYIVFFIGYSHAIIFHSNGEHLMSVLVTYNLLCIVQAQYTIQVMSIKDLNHYRLQDQQIPTSHPFPSTTC